MTDHSGNYQWGNLLKAYIKAQQDYPEGIGLRRSLMIKNRLVGQGVFLWKVPPQIFKELIDEFRKKWNELQKILDWLKSDHNEIDRNVTNSAELIADFSCTDCHGGGWYEYEDHDPYKDFTITEICECVIKQINV